MTIIYRASWSDEVTPWIEAAKNHIVDLTPEFKDAKQFLESEYQQRFQKEINPDGSKWPELAESTVKRRIAKNQLPLKKLQITRKYRKSFFAEVDKDNITWQSVSSYAKYHEGLNPELSKGILPKRSANPFTEKNFQRIQDLILQGF